MIACARLRLGASCQLFSNWDMHTDHLGILLKYTKQLTQQVWMGPGSLNF